MVHAAGQTWDAVKAMLARTKLPPISNEPVCRVEEDAVKVPRMEKWHLEESTGPKAAVETDGRYVVTGGNGALGSACVQWLLSRGAGSVVILSRRQPSVLNEAQVQWLQCDVSQASELKKCAEKIRCGGDVHGIIHAAGILADKMLADQTEQNIRLAFGPKVLAAVLLPQLLDPKHFVVFFSSAAAVLGSPGQVPYAAANGAMDGYSNHLKQARTSQSMPRVLSLQWGPWKEAGMAATESTLRRARLHGFDAWTKEQGIAVLNDVLLSSVAGALSPVQIDWERFRWDTHPSLMSNMTLASPTRARSEERLAKAGFSVI